ncbi:winged helix DNA-binding protein [Streptomyces sp. KhCrAH-43]|uniref:winged helix DNA-binding domain-containing protein n=1 Tax=unclassified Streptomyces TaxID=2593676 RepID=UPI00037AD6D5|nr:winged helix DNA-binding domain-containing protein [Streptomyces sp. KhCrAH-43]MYS33925.1 winged helix DNA-binding domain-containing protein [Streptomyces sp. SID4920]MYX70296.1 winged helix DNA-binding domain-containing protein [Streptomyces sp. SID8373]RAJ60895.1 winged helix DNA-binding protein [Streptomyces sp. KhCrAH-43]
MQRITDEQRRIRIGRRHLLAPGARASSPVAVADAVVGLHATDAATVFLSACARLAEPSVAAVEQCLYEDVSLVRMLSMRNTLFVVSDEMAPRVEAANARAVAAKERRTLLKHLREDGNGLDERWLDAAEKSALAFLEGSGPASGSELAAGVSALRTKITVFPGKKQETVQGVATRVIRVLAAEGRIRRDRPRGSWTSSQFRWVPARPRQVEETAPAQAELALSWLRAYGPGTEADLKWWTGWGTREARTALAAAGAMEVRLDNGAVAWVSPGDTEPEPEATPWAALLPALDPSGMGWADRGFHLPAEHRAALFDRSGNIGPTVWWNGGIVGGWAQRGNGELVWRLLADPGREASSAIEAEAARLADWVGEARITPRFRTPLERELTA